MVRMTKAQILSLTPEQIDKMAKSDLKQLKRITSDVQAINKKSYLRLKGKGMNTQFIRGYEKAGGPQSLRSMIGKDAAAQVKAELKTQLSLMGAKTRTLKGAVDVYKKMATSIDPEHTVFPEDYRVASKDEIKEFWDLYHKAKEVSGERIRGGHDGSPLDYELSNIITEKMREGSVDDITKEVSEKYETLYKERQKGIGREQYPFSIPSE